MRTAVPDIFDEVDQDLRADRAAKLFKQYGGVLIGIAVLVVAGAGGWQAWKWYDAKRSAEMAQSYLAAMTTADSQKGAGRQAADAQFAAIADKAGSGYRSLARLREAALKIDAGDLGAASALWDQVAADSGADTLLRDLANLQWAIHQIDAGDPAAVAARLQPLAAPNNPWHALAQEAQAMLALRQGKPDTARDTLKQLAQDATAPEGVRRRADGMLARLGG
jgi:hypothetical protein